MQITRKDNAAVEILEEQKQIQKRRAEKTEIIAAAAALIKRNIKKTKETKITNLRSKKT